MASINHLYMTVKGDYKHADLAAEAWQFGIRYLPALEASDIGAYGAPLGHFNTADVDVIDADATWDFRANYLLEGGQTDIDARDLLKNQIGPALKTAFEASGTYIADDVKITEVTLYPIGNDGKVVSSPLGPYKATAVPKVEINGANSGAIVPVQCTFAMTLQTASTGRRGHGRFYLPPMGATVISTTAASVPTAQRDSIQNTWNTFLQDSCLSGDPVTRPIVIGPPWTQYISVVSTRAGIFLDTQKRRRKSVAESYRTTTLNFT